VRCWQRRFYPHRNVGLIQSRSVYGRLDFLFLNLTYSGGSDSCRFWNMKRLKHILMGIALLVTLLPCTHAFGCQDHGHDSAEERCALDTLPCECHSCDHQHGSSDLEIQVVPSSISGSLPVFHPATIRLPMPKYKPAFRNDSLPVSGTLAVIQTVQLLI